MVLERRCDAIIRDFNSTIDNFNNNQQNYLGPEETKNMMSLCSTWKLVCGRWDTNGKDLRINTKTIQTTKGRINGKLLGVLKVVLAMTMMVITTMTTIMKMPRPLTPGFFNYYIKQITNPLPQMGLSLIQHNSYLQSDENRSTTQLKRAQTAGTPEW